MANVVFLWHMHQPYYVDPTTRTAMMPWVRLHSVRGYLDMISIIEEFPGIRANFNLTPVLLKQIKELIDGDVTDLWMEWARKPAADLDAAEKVAILENFFKINWDNLIKPNARFWELLNKRGLTFYRDEVTRGIRYFSTQEYLDLQVWFNLAWYGYTAFRLYPELEVLRGKGRNFTEAEKQRVLEIHMEILSLVLRKYREAEERGQVELTTTPFFHPILPLVYDSEFAERSLPGRVFPNRFHWPDDAAAHLTMAVEQHQALFGRRPRGLWPSEGSIAPELIPLMQRVGIEYFCSDEDNLFRSLKADPAYRNTEVDHLELFRGWRVCHGGQCVNALFRERPLSDFIGFMAAKNDPQDAARHLLHHLLHISELIPAHTGVIPLILDGENAWETFADGGEAFLRALYGGIEAEPARLHSCTIESYLSHHPPEREITHLHTGSWIGSNFGIWIGEEEENNAWDRLGEARAFLQEKIDAGALGGDQKTRALMEIYAAEGSDWFWWYGPDFHTENDDLFDELFRKHLKNVYLLCGAAYPARLDLPISKAPAIAVYEAPHQLIHPQVNGCLSSYFEWIGAGVLTPGREQGAMYRSERLIEKLHYGCDEENFYLRLDMASWEGLALRVVFHAPAGCVAESGVLAGSGEQGFSVTRTDGSRVVRQSLHTGAIVEWGIPFKDIGVEPGGALSFQVVLLSQKIERERYPENVPIELRVPSAAFVMENWIV